MVKDASYLEKYVCSFLFLFPKYNKVRVQTVMQSNEQFKGVWNEKAPTALIFQISLTIEPHRESSDFISNQAWPNSSVGRVFLPDIECMFGTHQTWHGLACTALFTCRDKRLPRPLAQLTKHTLYFALLRLYSI